MPALMLLQPEDVPGVRPDAERIEEHAALGRTAVMDAVEDGWLAVAAAAFRNFKPLVQLVLLRAHSVLGELNNLLLPPLFVLIGLDLFVGGLPEVTTVELDGASLVFAVTFLSEWLVGLWLARRKMSYVLNIWLGLDFISAMPLASAFQAFRLTRLARILRVAKLVRLMRSRSRRIPVAPLARAFALCGSIAMCGAVALQAMEPQVAGSLTQAIWWAATTITTVGYGDVVPTSVGGRLVGVALMITGIGVFSYLAGVMSAAVFDPEEDEILETVRRLEGRLAALAASIDRIEK